MISPSIVSNTSRVEGSPLNPIYFENKIVVTISTKIFNNGEFIGCLALDMFVDELVDIILNLLMLKVETQFLNLMNLTLVQIYHTLKNLWKMLKI